MRSRPMVGRTGLTSLGIPRIAGKLGARKDRSAVASEEERSLGCSRASQARRRSDALAAQGILCHGLRTVTRYKHLGLTSAKSFSMHLEAK